MCQAWMGGGGGLWHFILLKSYVCAAFRYIHSFSALILGSCIHLENHDNDHDDAFHFINETYLKENYTTHRNRDEIDTFIFYISQYTLIAV